MLEEQDTACVFMDGDKEELRRVLHKEDLEDVPPTVMAVALGRVDVLKTLLKKGCSIDATDEEGNTACMWAARLGNREMMKMLLMRRANPAARNKKGDDVLLTAAQSPEWCEAAFLELLAVVGDTYDVVCSNEDGWTALHYAVKKHWRAAVMWLLEAGVAVDAATRRGVTPLMLAASTGNHAILQTLVAARAAIFLEDERGCTAFCYAIAFMMRKRLNEPSHSVLIMRCAIRSDENSVSVDSYLQRRMGLLSRPPECVADFASIISRVISLVLIFFARFVQDGYELLLETRVFHNITQALLRHVEDAAHTRALLSLLLELLQEMLGRCFSGSTVGGRRRGVTKADVADCFVKEGAADACLSVLKWYNKNTDSSNEIQRVAMMPLILTCTTKSNARTWLQENYRIVRKFYKYEDWCSQKSKYSIDNDSLDLFFHKCQSFNNLMTNLKKGMNIVLSGRHKKKSKTTSTQHQFYKDRASRPITKTYKLKLLNENNSASDMYSSTDYTSLTPQQRSCPNKYLEEQTTENKFSSPTSQLKKRVMPHSHKNNTFEEGIELENIPVREVGPTYHVLKKSDINKHEHEIAVDGTEVHNSHNVGNYKKISEIKNSVNIWSLKREHRLDFTQQNTVDKIGSGDNIALNKSQGIKNILGRTYHIGGKSLGTCEKIPLIHQAQEESGQKPRSRGVPGNTKQPEANCIDCPDYDNVMSCLERSRNASLDESLTPDLRTLNFLFNNLIKKYRLYWQLVYMSTRNAEEINNILPVSEYKNFRYLTRVWECMRYFLEEIKDSEVFNKNTLNIRYTILKLDKSLNNKIKIIERNAANQAQCVTSNELNSCPYTKETVPKDLKQDNPETEDDILEECNQVVTSVIHFLKLDDTSDFKGESSGDHEFRFNENEVKNVASSKASQNSPSLINDKISGITPGTSPYLETETGEAQNAKLYSDAMKHHTDSATSANCQSPRQQDANNPTENQQTHSKTTAADSEAITGQCWKKVTNADRSFHLAVIPQTVQQLVGDTSRQVTAQPREEQPEAKSSDVLEPTQNNSNHVPSLKTCSVSKWDYLVGAFVSLSPNLRLLVAGGKAVMARREMSASFKVAEALELGLATDGTLLAVRRWRCCGGGRNLDNTLLSTLTPLLALAHANLLRYLLADRHDGELFVAAPLCEANLEQHVTELRSSGTLHSVAKVIAWQIMRGLQFLHSLLPPVVHGNLKPSNVLVDTAGVIKLADFGLGQVMRQLGHQPVVVWWPPEYLAPCGGQRRPPLVTVEGDVFSAGLLLHYAVTGGLHPFGSTRHQILCNMARSSPCFKSSEPDLAHLLAALFAPRAKDRPRISDVLRHVFFWDKTKRWTFLLACAGVGPQAKKPPEKSLVHLYQFVDSTAAAHNVAEDWVGIVKTTFPEAAREPSTLSALLRFVRGCAEKRGRQPGAEQQLGRYFLAALPNLPLKLFHLLDGTCHAARPGLARFFVGPSDVACWRSP